MNPNDALIDRITFQPPARGSLHKIDVIAPEGHWITASVLQSISWFALRYCAQAVVQQHGFSDDESGVEYPTDLDPDEDTFEGVRMYSFDQEMFVSAAAFDRLMLRYFEQMKEIATHQDLPVLAEPWWPEYLANVEVVRKRVHEQASGS